jgi:hypothetical protein
MPDWRDDEATNQTVYREMNEWTEAANEARRGREGPTDVYLCECSDPRCTDPISLTRQEYEAVRGESIRFAVALNHENPEIDRVIFENARYATVEAFLAAGARIARATDPRRWPSIANVHVHPGRRRCRRLSSESRSGEGAPPGPLNA